MDFKTRFTGKMSHISKDGAYDTVIKTNAAQGITKMGTNTDFMMMTGGGGGGSGDTGGPPTSMKSSDQIIQNGK